jgi:glutamine amidotransferase
MCRFLAYTGKPVIVNQLLYQPVNSIIKQSVHALEAEEPLNGDGFGLGWYSPEANDKPGLFVSISPAWNDQNLQHIAPKLVSDCVFAHVRAATSTPVNTLNCHPFQYKEYLFMHNGDIEGFHRIKREIVRRLPDEIYDSIRGLTDSEHLFTLFLRQLELQQTTDPVKRMANALESALVEVEEIKVQLNIPDPSYINACVTNGDIVVAVRYVSDLSLEASTMYYAEGTVYIDENGTSRLKKIQGEASHDGVLIVSEKLTVTSTDWTEIPVNHMVTVNKNLDVNVIPCERTLKTKQG